MGYEEIKEFYEMHYVDIKKFLASNFSLEIIEEKKNKKGKRWRIRHSEIEGLPFIAPISAKFSMRYLELVERGRIVVVKDEFNKYQTYINPGFIKEIMNESKFKEELNKYNEPFYELSQIASRYFQKKYLEKKLAEIEETKRILNHFHNDEMYYIESLSNIIRLKK